jgi:hypothetical protein
MKQRNRNNLIGTLLAVGSCCSLALASACAEPSQAGHTVATSGDPLTHSGAANLAERLTSADRIVATNWLSAASGKPRIRLEVPEYQVSRIVKAVSSAERLQGLTHSLMDWELQFFRGTNYLGVIRFQGSLFLADHAEYRDKTGVLDKLYTDLARREEQNRGN